MADENVTVSQAESSGPGEPAEKKRSPWPVVAGVVFGSVAIGVLLTGIAGGNSTGRVGRPSVTVGTATATAGDLPINLSALGSVTPVASVAVVPRASGTITRVVFTEGQDVKAGQVLAEIDPRPYRAALEQAQGQLARDEAQLANARIDLDRYQTLLKEDSIAKQQVDTQAALVRQDEGVVQTDRANVTNAQINLAYCNITAPLAGRIGLRQIDPGNYVAAGSSTPLVTITQNNPIDVVFTLPEDDLQSVVTRMASHQPIPVSAYDRTDKTKLADGQLITLDNVIDPATGTVKAKARMGNPSGALLANQFINVHLLVDTLKNAVIVPAVAIRHGPNGDFVWILTKEKTAEMRQVTTGPIVGEAASIASGVQLGETVITEGGDNLRDGAQVSLPGRPVSGGGFGAGRRGGRRGGQRFGGSGAPGAWRARQGGGAPGGGGSGGDE